MPNENDFVSAKPFDFSDLEKRVNDVVRDAWLKQAGTAEHAAIRLVSRLLGRQVLFPKDADEAKLLIAKLRTAGYELVIEEHFPAPMSPGLVNVSGLGSNIQRIAAYKREKVDEERIPPVTFHSSNAAGDRV